MSKLPPQPILDLLDDFTHAREALVQGLKKLGFSDEQAHAKIMRYQTETQQIIHSFKEDHGFHEATYDWQGRKKITITQKDLDTRA
jgi:hypothetical protein